ncbi:MAG: hypothetical protein ACJA0Z_001465 [Halioglobus sp.]|jgi:hypothetical protein
MNVRHLLLLLCVLVSQGTYAQVNKVLDVSLELQAYPTGVIPGIRFEKGFLQKPAFHFASSNIRRSAMNNCLFIRPTAAMGCEVNVDTDGENVGKILLSL